MASEQVNQHYNHDVDHDEDGEEDVDDNSDDNFNEQVDQPQIQIKSDQSEDDQGGGTRNGSPESLKGSLHSCSIALDVMVMMTTTGVVVQGLH